MDGRRTGAEAEFWFPTLLLPENAVKVARVRKWPMALLLLL